MNSSYDALQKDYLSKHNQHDDEDDNKDKKQLN